MAKDKGEKILEAAESLFAKYSLKKTSISDITAQAGFGKGIRL
ncbi:MAG: helix-turn-helix transcriptional regulator [Deltaproteobacteria bacterium]|nr:helix-turn-helix transcriptional regulator [Deltaproteobacteria bacterium]